MQYARHVVEQHLGRRLESTEIVHHINGDPMDDRLENLQVVSRAEHAAIHGAGISRKGQGVGRHWSPEHRASYEAAIAKRSASKH
jgi:hypothetical protein